MKLNYLTDTFVDLSPEECLEIKGTGPLRKCICFLLIGFIIGNSIYVPEDPEEKE